MKAGDSAVQKAVWLESRMADCLAVLMADRKAGAMVEPWAVYLAAHSADYWG